jgi:rare lipoprotein A (peptidoglycan hydrolase)
LTSASTTTLPGDSTTTSSTTTTVVHVTTTTTSSHERTGVATWYSYIPGRCADWYSPMGTRLHIESLVTHRIITCVVTDREAAHGNRVVDLSETQFAQLAPLAKGVTPVRVWWP